MSLYFCFYFANPFYFHVMIHITSKKLKKKKKWRNLRILIHSFLHGGKKWSNFLCFSTYLISFSRRAKKLSNFFHFISVYQIYTYIIYNIYIYIYIYIFIYIFDIIYIDRYRYKYIYIYIYIFLFITTKWNIFHQCHSFPRSGKNKAIFCIY